MGRRPVVGREPPPPGGLTGISVHSTFKNSPMRRGGCELTGRCPTIWSCLCGPSSCLCTPWGAFWEHCLLAPWPSHWGGKCFPWTPKCPSMRGTPGVGRMPGRPRPESTPHQPPALPAVSPGDSRFPADVAEGRVPCREGGRTHGCQYNTCCLTVNRCFLPSAPLCIQLMQILGRKQERQTLTD